MKLNMPCAKVCYLSVTAIVVILFGVLFCIAPPYSDDIWYLLGTYGVDESIDATLIAMRTCVDHWFWDTGRLANLISPPFLALFPRWVFAVLNAVALAMMIGLSRSLAGALRGSLGAWFILGAVTLCLPWLDQMISIIYALNYVWTSALMLATLMFFVRFSSGRGPNSRLGLAGAVVVALLAGWMHEGFSIPFIAGMCAYAVVDRRALRSRPAISVAVSLMIGTVLIFCAPATWFRGLSELSAFSKFGGLSIFKYLLKFDYLYFAMMGLVAAFMCVRKLRPLLFSRGERQAMVAFAVAGATLANIVMLKCHTGDRNFWCIDLMSMIGMVSLAGLLPIKGCRLRAVSRLASVIIALATMASMVAAIVEQRAINRAHDEVMKRYFASSDGNVFFRYEGVKVGYSWGKTTTWLLDTWMNDLFTEYYTGRPFHIVPASLEHFDASKERSVGSDSTCFIYDGNMVCDPVIAIEADDLFYVYVRLRDGSRRKFRVEARPFTAANGHRYVWLKPHNYLTEGIYYGNDPKPKWTRAHFPEIIDERDIVDFRIPESPDIKHRCYSDF